MELFWHRSPRWTSSLVMLHCKNCGHEYLQDISEYGYIVRDLTSDTKKRKSFWDTKFQCPKCRDWVPPRILALDTNPTPMETQWVDFLPKTDEEWVKWKMDEDKNILRLEDYRQLMPGLPLSGDIMDLFKRPYPNVEIKYAKFNPKVSKRIHEKLKKLWDFLKKSKPDNTNPDC